MPDQEQSGGRETVPLVSVVIPLFNEAGHLARLVDEIADHLRSFGPYEVICVDDGSRDETARELSEAAAGRPWLRGLRHANNFGKSAAIWTGVVAARAPVVATMNGDGRNDPAAVPRMYLELSEAGPTCGLVVAQRLGRHDRAARRLRSKITNSIRTAILDDGTRDATCGLKLFPRHVFLELPYFDGLHRFLPALVRRDGYAISLIDVMDRPSWSGRVHGGLFKGLLRGFVDLIGVCWLVRRRGHIPVLPDLDPSRAGPPGGHR